jgi:AcrR family transcriptional regulator
VTSAEPRRRRLPKQERSRAIVDSILAATEELLKNESPEALTTNRIAERAGVSIGSLYRYFPNKDAILGSLYDSEVGREAEELMERPRWPLDEGSLREALAMIVDYQLERHRRLCDLEGAFYRDHHREFSLARRVGSKEVEQRLLELLIRRGSEVRAQHLDQAAWLLARGVSAIVRTALEERPEKLDQAAFRDELVDLLVRYVVRG